MRRRPSGDPTAAAVFAVICSEDTAIGLEAAAEALASKIEAEIAARFLLCSAVQQPNNIQTSKRTM
jgi:hypothetical protein